MFLSLPVPNVKLKKDSTSIAFMTNCTTARKSIRGNPCARGAEVAMREGTYVNPNFASVLVDIVYDELRMRSVFAVNSRR